LENGNVAVQVYVEGDVSDAVGEEWLLILSPSGEVVSYFNGIFGSSNFFETVDTEPGFDGIAFTIINASITETGVEQGADPYFTVYQLSVGDLTDLPEGHLTQADLTENAEPLKTVNADGIGSIEDGSVIVPQSVGLVSELGGVYVIAEVGGVTVFGDGEVEFNNDRSVLISPDNEIFTFPGEIWSVTRADDDRVLIETQVYFDLEGASASQNSVFLLDLAAGEITTVQTFGTPQSDVLIGLGSNDVIMPNGAFGEVGDVIRLPTTEGEAGRETIVIDLPAAEADPSITVFGFDVVEDGIVLRSVNLLPDTVFTPTALTQEQFANREQDEVGVYKLFAVDAGGSTLLVGTSGGSSSTDLALFDNVNNSQLATTTIAVFNPDMLLETLPT